MKLRLHIVATVLLASAWLFGFRAVQNSGIKGTISPADAAAQVLVISGTDTLKAAPQDGAFSFETKPGTYKVIVEGAGDYKSVEKDGVTVEEGKVTDLGTITLEK
jgi:hypothetical protein